MNQFTFEKTKGAFTKAKIYHYYNLPVKNTLKQEIIAELVDKIIVTKKENIEANTFLLEKQLDEMVFKLYELTYEEVKVVAPDFWLSEIEYAAVEIE